MLLRRCTENAQLIAVVLALLVLAGCAGSASLKRPDNMQGSGGSDVPDAGARTARAIPPAVLTLFEQAAATMAGGDYVDAELRFKAFLLQYPQYPGAHVNLAIIHAGNSNDAAAEAAIDAALALQPDHPAALNQLGMLLRRNGKFLEAEAAYLKAVTVSPEYALAHYNLGVLNELYLQRLDVALQHFENYQALAGEDRQVAMWIADLTRRVAANQRTANVTE